MIGNKHCNFAALCKSLSQNQDEFDSFSKHFEINLNKIAFNYSFMHGVIGGHKIKKLVSPR